MSYMTKNARLITLALAAIFISAGVYATPAGIEKKTTEKARQAVKEAAPDDWRTYAQSAEKCIRKKVNLAEAKQWLEKSLEINENTYNLSVMGDYYDMNNLPEKALEYYVKSITIGLKQDVNYHDQSTHEKMMKARSTVLKSKR